MIIAVVLTLVFGATSCGTSSGDNIYECDDSAPTNPRAASNDQLAIAGAIGQTESWAVVKANRPDGGSAVEIEWKPAYTITNLTSDKVCVQDIRTDFPMKADESGKILALNSNGSSRLVDIFRDYRSADEARPAVTRVPPFELHPSEGVLVKLHQYFTLTTNGNPVQLAVDDNLATYLGPLFGLKRLPSGEYQCAVDYPLRTTVESSLGRLSVQLSNPIMPTGCAIKTR